MITIRLPKHKRTTKTNEMDAFFPVKEVRASEPYFHGLKVLVNELTDKRLGQAVSEGYKVTTHQEASNIVKNFLDSIQLPYESHGAQVSNGGARFFERIMFPTLTFNPATTMPSTALDNSGLRKDDHYPTITVGNSYDRTSPLSWDYGIYRVLCSNGADTLMKSTKLSFKHNQVINQTLVYDNLVRNLEDSTLFMTRVYQKLNQLPGVDYLNTLLSQNFSDGFKKNVLDKLGPNVVLDYKEIEDENGFKRMEIEKVSTDSTAYAVYEMVTDVASHQITNRDMQEKTNKKIAALFLSAV